MVKLNYQHILVLEGVKKNFSYRQIASSFSPPCTHGWIQKLAGFLEQEGYVRKRKKKSQNDPILQLTEKGEKVLKSTERNMQYV